MLIFKTSEPFLLVEMNSINYGGAGSRKPLLKHTIEKAVDAHFNGCFTFTDL